MTKFTVDLTELVELRPRVAELLARHDTGEALTAEAVKAIYDAERAAAERFTARITVAACPGHGVDRVELADACSAIASAISGVGMLSERWDTSPEADRAMVDGFAVRLVDELTAAGETPEVIAARVTEMRSRFSETD